MHTLPILVSDHSFLLPLLQWTKRYFVLHENKLLFYYKNDKDTTRPVKDPIKLSHCKCIESNLNHEKFKFVFSVVTDQRTYYLVADSQMEMETWVDKLTKVCGFRRTDQHQSSGEFSCKLHVLHYGRGTCCHTCTYSVHTLHPVMLFPQK